MFGNLLFIFIGIPLAEMMILIKLGEVMGFWPTLGLVIVTGFIGALAARLQGFYAYTSIQNELRAGRMPAEQMIDALLIFVAGILLITPGLLTDLTGFSLLVPFIRFHFKQWLRKKFDKWMRGQGPQGGGFTYHRID